MTEHQPELLSNENQSLSPEEQARCDAARKRLAEMLKDPQFRAIEGFPIGEDEDILALSDPPYYTACPNPFLPEIIAEWQQDREALRKKLKLSDQSYQREPFAADVSEGKHDPLYKAHTYHTKVPYKAIMQYVLYYTNPGDIVFDGFAGTGMTGIAAQLCEDPDPELKTQIEIEMRKLGQFSIIWGKRNAILGDLSPAATFIGNNYNRPIDLAMFQYYANSMLKSIEDEYGWMYQTNHHNGQIGYINYVVWSDVLVCPNCSGDIIFWDAAYSKASAQITESFNCPHCNRQVSKAGLDYSHEKVYDPVLEKTIERNKQIPVMISYTVGKKRFTKRPELRDLELLQKITIGESKYWFPTAKMMFKGEEWGCLWRSGYHFGLSNVHQFFSNRNLIALSSLWERTKTVPENVQPFIKYWITSTMVKASRLMNYNADGIGRVMKGSLYISSLIQEINPAYFLRIALRDFVSAFQKRSYSGRNVCIFTGSTSQTQISDASVDYVFIDPPFGQNLIYSELNFIWEAWLRVFTDIGNEAIVNDAVGKGLSDYQELMEKCFTEMHRILKPGHWMTIVFHNSQNSVWNSIQQAVLRAGFIVADVRTLDKQHGSIKQVTTTGAVKQDLVISAYKPNGKLEENFELLAGQEEGVWEFVRYHLGKLPVVNRHKNELVTNAERQAFLLFDRMVAFHIQRGVMVPISAPEFYAGLQQRFPPRNGMYFLPEQTAEYDRAVMDSNGVVQLSLFVTDEKTAIQWLRMQLDSSTGGQPQTHADLNPKFKLALHQAKHEKAPELIEILEQNFLQDEEGKWYLPDHNRASDLERVRMRGLLREFNEYATGSGRLRQFRTEAVRAGFADAYKRQDYETIIKVAGRLPEAVLREDPDLLMYYDSAMLRKK